MITPEEVKARLDALGWNYRKFAAVLHMSRSSVSQILSGARPLSPRVAAHMEIVLYAETIPVVIRPTEEEARALLPNYDRITPQQREDALKEIYRKRIDEIAQSAKKAVCVEMKAMVPPDRGASAPTPAAPAEYDGQNVREATPEECEALIARLTHYSTPGTRRTAARITRA